VKPTTELQPLIDAMLSRFGDADQGITAVVDLAVLVAMADGRIDEAEMTALMGTVDVIMGTRLAPAVAKHLVTQSRAQIRDAGAAARARELGRTLGARGAAGEGLRLAFAIAWTSEGLSVEERAIIDVVASSAGMDPERLKALETEVAPPGAA
jgi:tellurite resistance protein